MQVFITGATGYIDARKAVRLPRVAARPRWIPRRGCGVLPDVAGVAGLTNPRVVDHGASGLRKCEH